MLLVFVLVLRLLANTIACDFCWLESSLPALMRILQFDVILGGL